MGLRMVLRRLPLLLLLGCASNQSAFPMPPTFSPVEDAPLDIGQPGYVAPEPERSPHKRVLPQTPETMRGPGIWAGDEPLPGAGPFVQVAGTPVPMPPAFEGGLNPAINCAVLLQSGLTADVGLRASHDALSLDDRLCAATSTMLTCMHVLDLKNRERLMRAGVEQADNYKRRHRDIQAIIERLLRHIRLVCSDKQNERLRDLLDAWIRAASLNQGATE